MIFVCLGTQDFQFDRLLKKVDDLVEKGIIKEEVFAQSGYSTYSPSKICCKKFMDFNEFDSFLDRCNFVITHGGTGTIIKALRKKKKVIAIPRLKKYGEHVDDHQQEIIDAFCEKNLIYGLKDLELLKEAILHLGDFTPESFVSGNSKIISILDHYISHENYFAWDK